MSDEDAIAKWRTDQLRQQEHGARKAQFVLRQDMEVLDMDPTSLSPSALKNLREACLQDLRLLDELKHKNEQRLITIDIELSNQNIPKQEL